MSSTAYSQALGSQVFIFENPKLSCKSRLITAEGLGIVLHTTEQIIALSVMVENSFLSNYQLFKIVRSSRFLAIWICKS